MVLQQQTLATMKRIPCRVGVERSLDFGQDLPIAP
ncbi:hypothetical protein LYNGBM3L_23450 [Moorena producens 3L]|uniref:Uncharacterized protein n=1 Tax=Moorena producens 3L TaxID=489825 RepID=F4XN65_9CYAN|nr:hypothetical protein LYNGBM3L_23450 [Moorena producens 3L]